MAAPSRASLSAAVAAATPALLIDVPWPPSSLRWTPSDIQRLSPVLDPVRYKEHAAAAGEGAEGGERDRPLEEAVVARGEARAWGGRLELPRKERGHVQVEAHRVVVDRVWLITHRVLFLLEGGREREEREDGQREKERRNEKNITQPQLHPHSSPPYFPCPVNQIKRTFECDHFEPEGPE